MALSFPLSAATFIASLRIVSVRFEPGWQQEFSGLGSGDLIAADLAPARRRVSLTTGALTPAEAGDAMALIESLNGGVHQFELYDLRREYPLSDPDGSILGASTVTINSLASNGRALSLAGLPAAYQLSRGDWLSWQFGTGSGFRAFHRMAEPATANGSGVTSEFEVRHALDPGSVTGIEVTLIRASGLFRIEPRSVSEETVNRWKSRISFSAIQQFRHE